MTLHMYDGRTVGTYITHFSVISVYHIFKKVSTLTLGDKVSMQQLCIVQPNAVTYSGSA